MRWNNLEHIIFSFKENKRFGHPGLGTDFLDLSSGKRTQRWAYDTAKLGSGDALFSASTVFTYPIRRRALTVHEILRNTTQGLIQWTPHIVATSEPALSGHNN